MASPKPEKLGGKPASHKGLNLETEILGGKP